MICKINDLEFEPVIKKATNPRSDYQIIVKDGKVNINLGAMHYINNAPDLDFVTIIISKHRRFIYKRLSVIPNKQADSSVHYLGKEYKVNIIEADFNNVIIKPDLLEVYTKNPSNINLTKALIYREYEIVLRDIVDKYLDEIKQKLNIKFDIAFEYKEVKTYFGECYPKRRKVILNTRLAKYDLVYILSVIYHELAHFYYKDHQDGFYNLLEKVFPGYKKIQKSLRSIKYADLV